MIDNPQFYENVSFADAEDSVLNALMYEYFNVGFFKHTVQRKVITEILKRDSDIILSLPKDYGRTMCFQLPMLITLQKVSIVFVGLTSRIQMQMDRLKRENNCVEFMDSTTTIEDWARIFINIMRFCSLLSGKNTVLYMTPDIVPTLKFRKLMQYLISNNELGYIVVDESYHENYWLRDQTEEYHLLRDLRNKYTTIPWIVTTENGSIDVIERIRTTLCLRTHRYELPEDAIPCYGLFKDDEYLDR